MLTINSNIRSIGYDEDTIRTFTFDAEVTHPEFTGVSEQFGGEPLVELPRGTDLAEYVQMQYAQNPDFVAHMTNMLSFKHIKSLLTVETDASSILTRSLPRVAFLAMLDLMSDEKGMDIEAAILNFINTQMPTSTPEEKAARAVAKRLFTEGQEFVGTNPMFGVLVPALGLTQQEFEEAWETASTFTW